MVDLSRRSFLRGALTVAVVAATAPVLAKLPEQEAVNVPVVEQYPVLYGDGVHNDAPALNALFNGKPFICEDEVVTIGPNSCASLKDGVYLLKAPLFIGHQTVKITDVKFIAHKDIGDQPLLILRHHSQIALFSNLNFNVGDRPLVRAGDNTYALSMLDPYDSGPASTNAERRRLAKSPSRFSKDRIYIRRPTRALGGNW